MQRVELDRGPQDQDPFEILRRTKDLYDQIGMIYESEEIGELAAASFRGDIPRYEDGRIEIDKNGFRFVFFPQNQTDRSYKLYKYTITESDNGAKKISGGMVFNFFPYRVTAGFAGIKNPIPETISLTASEDAIQSFLREPRDPVSRT